MVGGLVILLLTSQIISNMKHVIPSTSLTSVLKAEKNNNGASFVIKSLKTGKEYTYTITRSLFNGKWYTHISVEMEYMNFKRIGTYFSGKIYNKKNVVNIPTATAIAWVLSKVEEEKFDLLNENVEISHTGSCLRCGRVLTDGQSIERGLGPTCSSK
jgi:hypothetical protein